MYREKRFFHTHLDSFARPAVERLVLLVTFESYHHSQHRAIYHELVDSRFDQEARHELQFASSDVDVK